MNYTKIYASNLRIEELQFAIPLRTIILEIKQAKTGDESQKTFSPWQRYDTYTRQGERREFLPEIWWHLYFFNF